MKSQCEGEQIPKLFEMLVELLYVPCEFKQNLIVVIFAIFEQYLINITFLQYFRNI